MRKVHELVIGVFQAHVPVAQRRYMQVRGHLLDFNAAVYSACWAVLHLVIGRSIARLRFAWSRGGGEQSPDA